MASELVKAPDKMPDFTEFTSEIVKAPDNNVRLYESSQLAFPSFPAHTFGTALRGCWRGDAIYICWWVGVFALGVSKGPGPGAGPWKTNKNKNENIFAHVFVNHRLTTKYVWGMFSFLTSY